jgi:hypothetical protein
LKILIRPGEIHHLLMISGYGMINPRTGANRS